jgi:glycosyltransferase involved in cell wall biosynthesis
VRPVELSVIVAVYNEEEVLDELDRRLRAALQKIGRSYEIILVDDGSRDRSFEIMQRLQSNDPEHIHALSFTRNFGHHIALTAGLDHAHGDVVIMMDADLQDQPEEIPKLLAKLDDGYDVVWGEREERQFKWYKNFSSHLFLWLMNSVARAEVHLNSSIFRAMRKEVAEDLRQLREKARYLPGLVSWLGYRQTSVPVVHGKRFAGETKYSLWRLIKLALSTATSFSAAPLQLATIAGLITAGVAVLVVMYVLIRKLTGAYAVPGYASVMIAIFFFGALQLIVIGLMGEYISRIYREAQGRPLYLLRDAPIKPAQKHSTEVKKLQSLPPQSMAIAKTIVSHDTHLPLAKVFPSADSSELSQYHWNAWQHSDPHVFQSTVGQSNAVSLFQNLEWDTRLLGVKAGRILYANANGDSFDLNRIAALRQSLRETIQFAKAQNFKLIDARVSNEDLFIMRAFEAEGFHNVDQLVTLGASAQKIDRALKNSSFSYSSGSYDFGNGLCVRPMRKDEVDTLAQISHESYGDHTMIQDRFFLEPSIPQDRAQNLFREWFLNLARKHQDGNGFVLSAELNDKTAGYVGIEPMAPFSGETWWKDSLNAVASDARGRGVYRALTIAALDYTQKIGAAGLITKTQSSTYRVINTWLHLGCDLLESFTTLHWTNES